MFKLSDRQKYRVLEIIPGALVWTTLVFSILLSFVRPLWVIYFIILFGLYWLLSVIYMSIWIFISWHRYRRDVKIDWLFKTKKIKNWEDIYHLIILPTYKEPAEVIRVSLDGLCESAYPLDKFIVVLGGEERDKEHFLANAEMMKKEYGGKFFKFLVTLHPVNLPGELQPAKGPNTNWMGHRAKELIDELKIPYENIVVSCFDVDTMTHPQYFACLAYHYLTNPNPMRASYQPVALYNNNIWESPAITRIVYNSTTFWLLSELSRPDRLITFSSHSMSFQALVDVGFWPKDIVSEDSQIFLRCLAHYNGDYSAVPIYVPVSMYTPYVGNFWRTLVNQYKQLRRWGYGAENFPFMVWNFWRDKKLPRPKAFRYIWNQLIGTYLWSAAPILILILGRLPLWVAGKEVKATTVAQNAPFILEKLMTTAMIGLAFSIILGILSLPPRPANYKKSKWLLIVLQWALFPIAVIFFGSIPSIEAQTRLMLGKYMGFDVTMKTK